MSRVGASRVVPLAIALILVGAAAAWGQDSDAAERQYRIARRLAAERSPEARAALEQVLALDPEGPFADDALVDQALLVPVPRWPEAVGRLDAAAAAQALGHLDDAVRRFPRGDRTQEAVYLRALLRLEPLAGYDPSAARVDLTAVATSASPWSAAARFALAWLHEHQGSDDRAYDAYQRLCIDEANEPTGARARVGLGRLLLRRGSFGLAALRLQEAIDAGVAAETRAETLRELAVRSLLREAGAVGHSRLDRVRTGFRSLVGFAPTANGGVLLADRKQRLVVELTSEGTRVGQWDLEDPQAVVADGRGGRFAAAGGSIFRLEVDRPAVAVASLADYAPVEQLAVDTSGGFWLLDRRGRRIGHILPGRAAPEAYWESDGLRLHSLVWDGRGLVAIDSKARAVVTVGRDGPKRTLTDSDLVRPIDLASDPSGRVAMLDTKTGIVRFLRADGTLEADAFASTEVTRPVAIGLGAEGELHVFDANGDWVVFR